MQVELFSAIATHQKIDAINGVIYGVSVITEGEAKNHNIWIDKTSLSQLHDIACVFKDGVKVKLSQNSEHDGSVGAIVGTLKNFRTEGIQERADLYLMKKHEAFDHIIELAQTQPENFGLSIVFPQKVEKLDGKNYARIEDIYSADLVEAPAANPTGLFSMKTKCSKKDGCECETCLSKKKTKETKMNAILSKVLKLDENATDEQLVEALSKALTASAPTDLTKLTADIETAKTELSRLTTQAANATALSKKNEIDSLLAQAARDGQVVPLDNNELYTEKEGAFSIHTEPSRLRSMLSKLPKGSVKLSAKVRVPEKDGKPVVGDDRIEFCRQKQVEGVARMTEILTSLRNGN